MKLFTLLLLLILSLSPVDAARGPTARRLRQYHAHQAAPLARRWDAPAPPAGINITLPVFGRSDNCPDVIAPKIFILSLFAPEATPWFGLPYTVTSRIFI